MIKFFRKIRLNIMESEKTGIPALPAGILNTLFVKLYRVI